METGELGRWGETKAANYLRLRGYGIVERNYRCRMGEIDLIARKRGFIVFVEVKLRKDAAFAQAREFVTVAKRRRVMTAAELWLAEHPTQLQPRFDVIEIYAPRGPAGPARIEHIENAFES